MLQLRTVLFTLTSFALLGAQAAGAAGVVEINQARVEAGGITAGDAPGFPATLSVSGSYVLTGNLTVPENVDGIHVTAADVAIDLAGFTIRGPGGDFAGTGIQGTTPTFANVRVREGSIRGMGRGVVLGPDSRVEGLHVVGNRDDGITIGSRSVAMRNTATGNGGRGIVAATSAIAKDNVTHENTGDTFVTWLLFPFVSNQAGYDFGFSIANTTEDPPGLGTTNQSGTCTLNAYGDNAPAAPFTSPAIDAGTTWETTASTAMPNFQGYVIARCAFPLAHGYGFLSDPGFLNVAAHVPALVIQPGRVQNLPEGLGQ